jgi:FkbM family methyltransferase
MQSFPACNRLKPCRHGTLLYNFHDAYIGRSLELYGEFSEGEVELFALVLHSGQTVVEVGANIGAHTVALAQLVGAAGHVLAFEPQRLLYQTLCANLALNSIPNVRCWHAAVGRAAGALLVPVLDYHKANNFGGISLEGQRSGERVPVLTVDSLDLAACHLLKVDVEGMEEAVLAGAAGTIARCKPLLYVENDREEKSAALIRAVAGLGYDLYWHCPPLFNPNNFARHAENVFGRVISKNMFCVPRGAAVTVRGLKRVEVPALAPSPVARAPALPAPGAALDAARRAHQAGDLATAVERYQDVLQADAGNAQVWYLLGAARQKMGRLEEAAAALREAVRLEPHRAEAHNHLGVVLAQQHQFGPAEASFRRALELRPSDAEAHQNLALALTELDRPDEALAAFDAVLRLVPGHADALNGRGQVHLGKGETEAARDDFQGALERRPDFTRAWANMQRALGHFDQPDSAVEAWRDRARERPASAEVHLGLGRVLLAQGKSEEAVASLREAVRLGPDLADVHLALGTALRQLGLIADACTCFRRAVQLVPGQADPFINLGLTLIELEQYAEAETALREALRLRPDAAHAHNNLCIALRRLGRPVEAIASGQRAVELVPDFVSAYNNLGLSYLDDNRLDEATAALREAVRLQPDFAQGHNNLAIAHWRKGRLDDAEASYREALRLRPDFPEALNNLGNTVADQGRFDEGLLLFAEAEKVKPDYVDPRWNRALIRLLQGDLERGFAEYEARFELKHFQVRRPEQPRWDGSDLAGRTILLHPEQGLGDTLQMVRYLPLVKARGGRVLFECPKALMRLLAGVPGADQVVPQGSALPPFDVHLSLLSLPAVLGPRLEAIPAQVPYLRADPALVETWRKALATREGLKVGIGWQGSTRYRKDHSRSIPLARFGALARIPGVRLISLQKGPGCEQVARVDFRVADLGADFDGPAGPFMDTAAVMSCLDLVITSDTVIPHLAGALGVPTWVALPTVPDWRWLLGCDDSPWYPTLRLFRQERPGDWSSVFGRIAVALQSIVRDR